MDKNCADSRAQIPLLVMEDLSLQEQQDLELHLKDCPSCSRELELYRAALGEMASLQDAEVPRHFFVYPEERSPWLRFRQLPVLWRGVPAGALVLALVAVGLAAAGVHVRIDEGAWRISLGAAPAGIEPAVDPVRLKAEVARLIRAVERRQDERWMRVLSEQLGPLREGFTPRQGLLIDAALLDLEDRMERETTLQVASAQREMGNYVVGVVDSLDRQYGSDVRRLDRRIDSLAAWSEVESEAKTSILHTLLQSTEFRSQ